MITLVFIAILATSVEALLFKIAVSCVVVWGVWELIKWLGWAIPRPVQIILICLFCILLIYWGFEVFEALK